MNPYTFWVGCPLKSEFLMFGSLKVETHHLALGPCHFVINAKAIGEKPFHTASETCTTAEKFQAVATIIGKGAM